jgi:hypothetical protein
MVKKANSEFWTNLTSFGVSFTDSWLCIGDFNSITSQNDKYGGRPFNSTFANPFTDFFNTFGMVDLGFSGNPYTWSITDKEKALLKNVWIEVWPQVIGFGFSLHILFLIYWLIVLITIPYF